MASSWYFQSMGNVVGPITSSELRLRAAQGQIDLETLVAKDVPDNWVKADKVTGLFAPRSPNGSAGAAANADATATADSGADLPSSSSSPMLSGIGIFPPIPPPPGKHFAYKVLTPKDKAFAGKYDAERLEEALNVLAREGWRVVAALAGSVHGFTSTSRDEIVVLLERQVPGA